LKFAHIAYLLKSVFKGYFVVNSL